MLQRVNYQVGDITDKRTCIITVTLKDGTVLTHRLPQPGAIWAPASLDEVRAKYGVLMRDYPKARADELFERIQNLEAEPDLEWLRALAAAQRDC